MRKHHDTSPEQRAVPARLRGGCRPAERSIRSLGGIIDRRQDQLLGVEPQVPVMLGSRLNLMVAAQAHPAAFLQSHF